LRSQTPPLAAGALIVTVHIVLNDFGLPGRALCETDELQADEGNRHRKHPRRPIFASPLGARLKNRRRLGARCHRVLVLRSIVCAAKTVQSAKPRRSFSSGRWRECDRDHQRNWDLIFSLRRGHRNETTRCCCSHNSLLTRYNGFCRQFHARSEEQGRPKPGVF